MIERVAIIGWGRLARHLAARLEQLQVEVVSVHTRADANLDRVPEDVDALLIAVSDAAIAEVAAALPDGPTAPLRIHHAGSIPLSHGGFDATRSGVIWPPQTFQLNAQGEADGIDWAAVPVAVQSENADIIALAKKLSPLAFELSESQRIALHLGAVLAGNLTAAWLGQVAKYCKSHDLPFEVLHALVSQSVTSTLRTGSPPTGPAARGDRDVLTGQLDELASTPELQEVYKSLTNAILAHHGHAPL